MEPYKSKTDEELEQLAQDIVAEKVFHTFYHSDLIVQSGLSVHTIFMPLLFMDGSFQQWMEDNDIYAFYEYYSKAGPRSCNGMPCFFSVCYTNTEDMKRLHTRVYDLAMTKQARMEQAGGN